MRDWEAYAAAATAGTLAVASQEEVDPAARRLERVWLGLRTDRGVPWADLGARARALIGRWEEAGLAEGSTGAPVTVRLTTEGWLLLDRLAVDLDDALEEADGGAGGRDRRTAQG